MKLNQVPFIKIGTPYQRPSWRYDALTNPQKYGLVEFMSDIQQDAGFIKRLVSKGVTPSSVYTYPQYFKKLASEVPSNLAPLLEKIWNKHYFSTHKHKMSFNEASLAEVKISWKMSRTEELTDEYFRRIIMHVFNYVHDEDIEYALRFGSGVENAEIKRYVGYSFFAGISEKDISKRWKVPLNKVKAIRNIYFDFSHFPNDRMARFALLKQLAEIHEIDEQDFSYYRKVYDLGELGLRSITDPHNLTIEDQHRIDKYIGETGRHNTMNLHLSIRTAKDALAYNSVVQNFARLGIMKEELRTKEVALRLTELHILKATKELNIIDTSIVVEDEELLKAMKDFSRQDIHPQFKPYANLLDLK